VHVHVFGVGSPKYLLELRDMGVASADSSLACLTGAHFGFVDDKGVRRRLKFREKNKYMTASLIAWNMATVNFLVEKGNLAGVQMELFEEVGLWS